MEFDPDLTLIGKIILGAEYRNKGHLQFLDPKIMKIDNKITGSLNCKSGNLDLETLGMMTNPLWKSPLLKYLELIINTSVMIQIFYVE